MAVMLKREQFQQDLKAEAARLDEADRRLHVVLGLPPEDGRRLVTVTRPIDQDLACELRECRTEMSRMHASLIDRMLAEALSKGWVDAFEQQTRPLEGACAVVGAGYLEYQRAERMRIEAEEQLTARKDDYDEGCITAAQYLDAVRSHGEAVVAEAESLFRYNAAIAAFGAAKGTLLRDRLVMVIDQPLRIPKNWVEGPPEAVKQTVAPRAKPAGVRSDLPVLVPPRP